MIATSRRRFLQVAGLVGASFALGFACSGSPDPAPEAPRAPRPSGTPTEIDAYIASVKEIGGDGAQVIGDYKKSVAAGS